MNRIFTLVLGIILLLVFRQPVQAQTDSVTTSDSAVVDSGNGKKVNWLALPIVFYTPETNWAFGAAGFLTFRFRNQAAWTKPSQLQLGGAYTLNKQVLMYLPYRLYFSQEKNLLYGELGYYKYNFFYFGVGNGYPRDYSELFDVTFPRVRINYMRKWTKYLYAGGRFVYDGFQITGTEPGGELDQDLVTGSDGGVVSGLGLAANWDSRDNIFWPSEGEFAEAQLLFNHPVFGSDFSYTRFTMDIAKYIPFKWGHILAQNVVFDFEFGDPPFNQMAMLGGPKKMRGMYEGRFRDRNAIIYQAEYRAPIWWRLGAVAFAGVGNVAPKVGEFDLKETKLAWGGGIRFEILPAEKLHLRLDYGRAVGGGAFYFTVGEAF